MASLQINTGMITLDILGDDGQSRGLFRFNPTDIEVAKKVFALQQGYSIKIKEYYKKIDAADTPEKKLEVLDDIVSYLTSSIDDIFGIGSSQILFGGAKTITMFDDFFKGIMPYFEEASKKRMSKYS